MTYFWGREECIAVAAGVCVRGRGGEVRSHRALSPFSHDSNPLISSTLKLARAANAGGSKNNLRVPTLGPAKKIWPRHDSCATWKMPNTTPSSAGSTSPACSRQTKFPVRWGRWRTTLADDANDVDRVWMGRPGASAWMEDDS